MTWNDKTAHEADTFVAAFDWLTTGAVIVSETLELVCLNRQAEALLGESGALRVRDGELEATCPEVNTELRAIVGMAVGQANEPRDLPNALAQVMSVPRKARLPLDVRAVLLRPRVQPCEALATNVRVMLLINDPDTRRRVNPRLVELLFDLTPTEASIAASLAEGMSITDVVNQRSCLDSTVRTHLKGIFRKTRTKRQAELVHLILTSLAASFDF
jgi:DNA-binding CsgD family transcriptional regulator